MILIKNGRLIDPLSKRDEVVDIVIENDKIKQISKNLNKDKFEKIIDATNCVVAPGLIDIHVHFRDPGFTYKEDIFTGAKAAAKGGFTTVVCMANTKPTVDNKETLKYILDKGKKSDINILQVSTVTKELKGKELVDFDEMVKSGAVGFSDDGIPLKHAKIVYEAMKKAKELNVPISLHEENPSFIIRPGVNDGKISKQLGLEGGATSLAENIMVSRDIMIALETGAKVNIQHISSKEAVKTIKFAKALGANVYAEASPHHFTLNEEVVLKHGSLAKMNPPLRTEEDRLAIIEGLKDDTIEIIATDHAPHSKEEKENEFTKCPSGITGLETSLGLGIKTLVNGGHLDLMHLLEKMTINPAKLYNLERGYIKEGGFADIVIFNPNEKWEVKEFASKATNTPFTGEILDGKIKYTICEGKIVYKA